MTRHRKKLPAPEEIVAAIVDLGDDGLCAAAARGWNLLRNG